MKHNTTIKAFLNAVNTWKTYVKALAKVNKANCNKARGLLMKAMFFWRKECERLKKEIDSLLLYQRAYNMLGIDVCLV